MGSQKIPGPTRLAAGRGALTVAAFFAALLALAPVAGAQTEDSKPEELARQRSDLYLRATRASLPDLGNDVNRIAVASETCRVKYGSTPCGLPDKALESDKLEERYDYYVKQPVEAHAKAHPVKVDRRNWTGSGAPEKP